MKTFFSEVTESVGPVVMLIANANRCWCFIATPVNSVKLVLTSLFLLPTPWLLPDL